jgi:hypothetical protein
MTKGGCHHRKHLLNRPKKLSDSISLDLLFFLFLNVAALAAGGFLPKVPLSIANEWSSPRVG